ncbi:MAG: hypothetical protein HC910_14665 [Spirulinaceae cyanobacterium SM2_1_0]|nr:hypothetical protein [Spirulinaceae cyanobacterium SM2_1_0]
MRRSEVRQFEVLGYYAKQFQRLRVDRAHGLAPHKPILLLAVIELIARSEIERNRIDLGDRLNHMFLKYWSYLGSVSHNPDISQPFYYLKSSKFWHLVANPGYARVITDKLKLKTLADVRRVVHYAYLDEDLFDFLREPKYRQCLLEALVLRWFSAHGDAIAGIAKTDRFCEPPAYRPEAYERFYVRADLPSGRDAEGF